ncbi:hypothetical protein ACQF36_28730 [Streptomyces sp. Marseille-Q5077]|uniref:hypothetical protein n=1 Tax=Streptomyces sp. Marseille-Q5077 TaxID=3418995 RepID=UPI003D06ED6C
MATDSLEDSSLLAPAEAAMGRPAFQEGFLQLAHALSRTLPSRQVMMDSMSCLLRCPPPA